MTVVLIPALLVLFALAATALAVVTFQQDRELQRKQLAGRPSVLAYVVPEGQDPVVVIAALESADLDIEIAPGPSSHVLLLGPGAGADPLDREHVRSILADVRRANLESDRELALPEVLFVDELPDGTCVPPPHLVDPGTPAAAAGPQEPDEPNAGKGPFRA